MVRVVQREERDGSEWEASSQNEWQAFKRKRLKKNHTEASEEERRDRKCKRIRSCLTLYYCHVGYQ